MRDKILFNFYEKYMVNNRFFSLIGIFGERGKNVLKIKYLTLMGDHWKKKYFPMVPNRSNLGESKWESKNQLYKLNLNLNHLATKLSHILLFLSQFLKQFMNLKLILQRKDKDVESECIIDSQNRDKRGKYIVKYNCEAESDDKPEAVGNRDELP